MKNLLIIVDMQKAFINENTKRIDDKIQRFIEKSVIKDVVATRYINHENTACYSIEGWKECMEGTERRRKCHPY